MIENDFYVLLQYKHKSGQNLSKPPSPYPSFESLLISPKSINSHSFVEMIPNSAFTHSKFLATTTVLHIQSLTYYNVILYVSPSVIVIRCFFFPESTLDWSSWLISMNWLGH